jgi:hypothetical protein
MSLGHLPQDGEEIVVQRRRDCLGEDLDNCIAIGLHAGRQPQRDRCEVAQLPGRAFFERATPERLDEHWKVGQVTVRVGIEPTLSRIGDER